MWFLVAPMRRILPLFLLLAACAVPDVPDTGGPTGAGTGTTAACTSDDDCDPGDFCISGHCQGASAGPAADAGGDSSDAGPGDAGRPDSGTPDSGSPDAGTPDSGTPDAGAPDAGTPDAGTPDAGTPDAGVTLLGHITVTPSTNSMTAQAGQQPAAQSFTVGNDGTASAGWTASCTQGTLSPSSGTLAVNGAQSVSVTLPTWSAAGTQTVTCTARGTNADTGSGTWTLTVAVSPPATTPIGPTGGTVDLLDFVMTGDTRPTACYDQTSSGSCTSTPQSTYPAANFQAVVAKMASTGAQFGVDLGDHQYTCCQNLTMARAQIKMYTDALSAGGFTNIWFMTMGNHECGAGSTADCSTHTTDANYTAYKEALSAVSQQSLPYYKVDVQTRLGLARLVFIADNWYSATAQNWLESTLTEADSIAKYTIIVKHHPIAEDNCDTSSCGLRIGPSWSYNVLTSGRHKYTLVLTAHTHEYDHDDLSWNGRWAICGLGAASSSCVGYCRVQQQADGTLKFSVLDQYGNPMTKCGSYGGGPSSFTVTPQ